jgi:hypothetical protein
VGVMLALVEVLIGAAHSGSRTAPSLVGDGG